MSEVFKTNNKISSIIRNMWEDPSYRERQMEKRRKLGEIIEQNKANNICDLLLEQVKDGWKGFDSRLSPPSKWKSPMSSIEEMCATSFFGKQLISIISDSEDIDIEEAKSAVEKLMLDTKFTPWSSSELQERLLDKGLEMSTRIITKYVKTKLPRSVIKKSNDGLNKFSLFDYDRLEKGISSCPICNSNIWDDTGGQKVCAFCGAPSIPTLGEAIVNYSKKARVIKTVDFVDWVGKKYPPLLCAVKEKYPSGRYNYNVHIASKISRMCKKGVLPFKVEIVDGFAVWTRKYRTKKESEE